MGTWGYGHVGVSDLLPTPMRACFDCFVSIHSSGSLALAQPRKLVDDLTTLFCPLYRATGQSAKKVTWIQQRRVSSAFPDEYPLCPLLCPGALIKRGLNFEQVTLLEISVWAWSRLQLTRKCSSLRALMRKCVKWGMELTV